MAVSTLELDYEGFSARDLLAEGLDNYTADPSTRPLMAAYALDGGDWHHWEAHKRKPPTELVEALADPNVEKWAFNAQFERVYTNRVMKLKSPIKNWRCTMVLSYLHSFSGGLDKVGMAVGLPTGAQKLKDGKRLIQKFCMPQAITKNQPYAIRDWNTDPADWELFCRYNVGDCVAERAVKRRLLPYDIGPFEWELYECDQEINDRGFDVDLKFVRNAIIMSAKRRAELLAMMKDITDLANPGSVQQLLPWLRERGYPFADLQKESVQKALTINTARIESGQEPSLDPWCARVLELRAWQAKLSVMKYDKIVKLVGKDSKLRYLFQFAGASRTARWAGRGVQTQNLARTPKSLKEVPVLEACTAIIRDGDYELLNMFMKEPMEALTGCLRGSFVAPEGEKLVVCDLSSIETVVIAWLSGCKRLLDVIKSGLDPYKDFATRFFGVAYEDVEGWQRQICKPPLLGCGYRLSAGAIYDGKKTGLWGYAENMGVNLSQSDCKKAVDLYRNTYLEIPEMWKELEKAIDYVITTRKPYQVGFLHFRYVKPYLEMILPSGRSIKYYQPRIQMETVNTGRMVVKTARTRDEFFMYGARIGEQYEVEETYRRRGFSYMGKTQNTNQWTRIKSHGGKTIEQATQGAARDIFAAGMIRAARQGFKIVGHAHDELITRCKNGDNYYTLERLRECMREAIEEYPGLPLNAAGYVSQIYRKD